MRLLVAGDIDPVAVENPGGRSRFLLLGDHAGRIIPSQLGDLGLGEDDRIRHIAWDIGVAGLGARLARKLNATFIRQTYSRLVIDCNRALGVDGSMPAISDGATIGPNRDLAPEARSAREREIFAPYHGRIAAELDSRPPSPILVSLHSFTPSLAGDARPWRVGVLHRHDSAFSSAVLAGLKARLGEAAGDNQPYAMDGTDFTIPHHADPRGLDYLELEVRQDLIADTAGQDAMAELLAEVLVDAETAAAPRA